MMLAYSAAKLLEVGASKLADYPDLMQKTLDLVMPALVSLNLTHLFQTSWRFAAIQEALSIFDTVATYLYTLLLRLPIAPLYRCYFAILWGFKIIERKKGTFKMVNDF